ncbi:MAG TPA: undecaprenyl-diphosphate phosphatase [Ktedonobacterales bacterium]|jgi:undecaprenyl-diphosphatase|nr:undecaprenyl-diphosphate phosphatase [Ktedonobacterales bacterium]
MDLIHVLLLALLQGVTELFPVSSLGHTVIIPGILGWKETLDSPTFLPLLVTLHLGTSVALLTFFWRDWVQLLRGGLRTVVAGRFTPDVDPDGYGRQLALVVVGTIPAGIIGLLFQHQLEAGFSIPILAAAFLVANGAVLLAGERLWRGQRLREKEIAAQAPMFAAVGRSLNEMSFKQAAIIGFAQSFALIPGFSRSGLTMVTGMANGLSHEAAARFSFLLATPIILAAGVLEIPKLLAHQYRADLPIALGGGVVAGIAAYLSVRFLMKYFETNRLDPFAYYCVAAGALAFLYFLLQFLGIIPA